MSRTVYMPPDQAQAHASVAVATALAISQRRAAPKRTRFVRVPLYPKQAAIVDDPARFTMTEATPKAGKTMSHIEWLLGLANEHGAGNFFWVATTQPVAKMAFRRTVDRLEGMLETRGQRLRIADPVPFQKNETERFIRVFGAWIWFKGADEPDSLFGEDVRGLVGDEVSRWKEAAFNAVYTTLTSTGGRAKFIGNVKGRRNWAYRKARKAELGEPGWGYHKLTALDAIEGGLIDPETIEAAKRDLPDDVFRELYMADAVTDTGNPFGDIADCIAPLSDLPPVVWGWDLAKSVDWTVGIGLDRDGRVCRFERFQRSWDDTLRAIVATSGPAFVDATGVGDPIVEQLQRDRGSVVGVKFTSQSKQQLMEGLSLAIQRRDIRFPDGPISAELEAFEYEYTRTGVRYGAPTGMHDDCVCALALAVSGLGHTPRAINDDSFAVSEMADHWSDPAWRV